MADASRASSRWLSLTPWQSCAPAAWFASRQRPVTRGLNASAHAYHFLQLYNEHDLPARTGYQLFLQGRLGWRWTPGAVGFWVEPSVAFNWWPIEVGRPDSFRAKDARWPSYFLFEPWLNFGWSW